MASKIRLSPIGRLSFPSLFEPKKAMEGDSYAYEATLIFPAGTDLSEIEQAIDEAAEAKWGAKKSVMLKKVKHYPIKRNEDCTDNEGNRRAGYEDGEGRHVKFKNEKAPNVIGRTKDPETGKWLALTKDEIFAGCYVKASFTCFAGEHEKGGPYVRMSLQNVQLIKEGEPFGGVVSDPNDDFTSDVDEDVLAALG